jgi:hypothetical protein
MTVCGYLLIKNYTENLLSFFIGIFQLKRVVETTIKAHKFDFLLKKSVDCHLRKIIYIIGKISYQLKLEQKLFKSFAQIFCKNVKRLRESSVVFSVNV